MASRCTAVGDSPGAAPGIGIRIAVPSAATGMPGRPGSAGVDRDCGAGPPYRFQVARRLLVRHEEPLPAIAPRAMSMDTLPRATHTRPDRFNPTNRHHVRDQRLPHIAARLSQPRQRNRRPDRRMNKRTIRRLARLTRRYENCRTIPLLKDVEAALWRAGEVADRRLGGYWPWGSGPFLSSNIEHWTSYNLG